MFKAFCKLYFHYTGWGVHGRYPDEIDKLIVIVGSHTSNWDFIVGVGIRTILKVDVKFLGKKELFRFPFKSLFLSLGGYPVDRSASHNTVDKVVEIFEGKKRFAIAMSPEGTRKKVDRLKSGFYHIAKKANIPIVMVGLDYGKKMVEFSDPFHTTDDQPGDFRKIVDFFKRMKGKYPDNGIYDQYT